MQLIIISGLSGAGKSAALSTLEDSGYYCIDNLPIEMLAYVVSQMLGSDKSYNSTAVGIDIRSGTKALNQFPNILNDLKTKSISVRLIFLKSDKKILLKRFSETRRKHPLSQQGLPLENAIDAEIALLEPLLSSADLVIDTNNYNIHQLRDVIRQRVAHKSTAELSLLFQSFGFKHGIPQDSDFVFDVRCLPNPHWQPHLRDLSGQQPEVKAYLEKDALVQKMLKDLIAYLSDWITHFEADNRSYLTISIGCTGGFHRSVFLVESLTTYFKEQGKIVTLRHRELS